MSHLLVESVDKRMPPVAERLSFLGAGAALGFAVRRLYTDDEEVLFQASRPTLLNGIDKGVSRLDLGDRALFLT
jgi:hypothetical protein